MAQPLIEQPTLPKFLNLELLPSDGGNDNNDSWDSGNDQTLRRQRLRNFWTIQFFSRGIPMSVWGDEFGRTQNGNNNPYNLDSVATWNNYNMIATRQPHTLPTGEGGAYHNNFGTAVNIEERNPLFVFASYIAYLRNAHHALRQRKYGDFILDSVDNVTYLFRKEDGETFLKDGDRCIWLQIDGSAVGDQDFLLFINMYSDSVQFQIPKAAKGKQWGRLIDTAAWAEPFYNFWKKEQVTSHSGYYDVHPFSIVVLAEMV